MHFILRIEQARARLEPRARLEREKGGRDFWRGRRGKSRKDHAVGIGQQCRWHRTAWKASHDQWDRSWLVFRYEPVKSDAPIPDSLKKALRSSNEDEVDWFQTRSTRPSHRVMLEGARSAEPPMNSGSTLAMAFRQSCLGFSKPFQTKGSTGRGPCLSRTLLISEKTPCLYRTFREKEMASGGFNYSADSAGADFSYINVESR